MAVYNFKLQPAQPNKPACYTISEVRPALDEPAGTLTKRKQNWELRWNGTTSIHPTKLSVRNHLRALGHAVNGL